jgi:hypothetical protein
VEALVFFLWLFTEVCVFFFAGDRCFITPPLYTTAKKMMPPVSVPAGEMLLHLAKCCYSRRKRSSSFFTNATQNAQPLHLTKCCYRRGNAVAPDENLLHQTKKIIIFFHKRNTKCSAVTAEEMLLQKRKFCYTRRKSVTPDEKDHHLFSQTQQKMLSRYT